MNHAKNRLRLPACLVLLGLCVACGRASESAPKSGGEPAAPATGESLSSEAEREPATLAEAEQLLERARADIDRLALNDGGSSQPGSATAGAPSPTTAPAPAAEPRDQDKAQRAEKSSADEAAPSQAPPPPAKEVSACETACKAFASLERASDAVCRLDSDGGERCQRARQIRQDASRRVASCGCSR